jgi:hypothetical protein
MFINLGHLPARLFDSGENRLETDIPGAIRDDANIPILDVRRGGPVEHARARRDGLLSLREECFSIVPRPLRWLAPLLDRLSSSWLARTPSPYVDEIAAIADISRAAGVWFVNASYEWGCTTRVDAGGAPHLCRTLDWPFPGLGRRVEVALQDGGAGPYANVTWPGAVGVLTGLAPGRFAAAINQAPMFRRTRGVALFPLDLAWNAVETFRKAGCWPAAHLLRRAFDTCASFDDAVALLSTAPLARPTLFSLVGAAPGQACLIERTQRDAVVRRGDSTIANDWHPEGPPREGYWMSRGTYIRGADDSERRRRCLQDHCSCLAFDWVRAPVRNGFTRLAVEASAATGELRVVGFEPTGRRMHDVRQATPVLDAIVDAQGIHARDTSAPARRAANPTNAFGEAGHAA